MKHAKEQLTTTNTELVDIDENLHDEIWDMMEEYGEEHELSEGWWLDHCTPDDIVANWYGKE